jgi:hypothetical protein
VHDLTDYGHPGGRGNRFVLGIAGRDGDSHHNVKRSSSLFLGGLVGKEEQGVAIHRLEKFLARRRMKKKRTAAKKLLARRRMKKKKRAATTQKKKSQMKHGWTES